MVPRVREIFSSRVSRAGRRTRGVRSFSPLLARGRRTKTDSVNGLTAGNKTELLAPKSLGLRDIRVVL